MFYGGLLNYGMIGFISVIVAHSERVTRVLDTKLTRLSEFMNLYEVEPGLRQQVIGYYRFLWAQQQGLDGEKLLEGLPMSLREAVAAENNLRTVRDIPLFKGCSERLLLRLTEAFHMRVFLPQSDIVTAGEVSHEIFILSKVPLPPLCTLPPSRAHARSTNAHNTRAHADITQHSQHPTSGQGYRGPCARRSPGERARADRGRNSRHGLLLHPNALCPLGEHQGAWP